MLCIIIKVLINLFINELDIAENSDYIDSSKTTNQCSSDLHFFTNYVENNVNLFDNTPDYNFNFYSPVFLYYFNNINKNLILLKSQSNDIYTTDYKIRCLFKKEIKPFDSY